jgi:ABC-type dipeptide/oligopeptide/nickel transport system permease subunit
VGYFFSPYSAGERNSFSVIGKTVYGFITGYLVSKLDPLIDKLSHGELSTPSLADHGVVLALFSVACFLITVPLTYITRAYWVRKSG